MKTAWAIAVMTLAQSLPGCGESASLTDGSPPVNLSSHGLEQARLFTYPFDSVFAGVVTDQTSEESTIGDHLIWRTVKVTQVLRGDPRQGDIRVVQEQRPLRGGESRYILTLQTGDAVLVGDRSPQNEPQTEVFPDTPVIRKFVEDGLRQRDHAGLDRQFIDAAALVDAAETLIRDYLADLAKMYPQHPQIGAKAAGAHTFVRTVCPPGVYVRIVGKAARASNERFVPIVPASDDEIVLWIGAGVAPHQSFRVGHPSALVNPVLTASMPQPRSAPAGGIREETLPGSSPLQMSLYAAVPDTSENGAMGRAIYTAFCNLNKALDQLNRDPPRNLDAAIAEIVARHAQFKKAPPPGADGVTEWGMCPMAVDPRHINLYNAFDALSSEFAAKHLGRREKATLIPVLIDLLTDRSVVANLTPCDGPIICTHQRAYTLLVTLSAQNLPAPIGEPPRGGRGPMVSYPANASPEDPQKKAREATQRQDTWRQWWQNDGWKQFEGAAR